MALEQLSEDAEVVRQSEQPALWFAGVPFSHERLMTAEERGRLSQPLPWLSLLAVVGANVAAAMLFGATDVAIKIFSLLPLFAATWAVWQVMSLKKTLNEDRVFFFRGQSKLYMDEDVQGFLYGYNYKRSADDVHEIDIAFPARPLRVNDRQIWRGDGIRMVRLAPRDLSSLALSPLELKEIKGRVALPLIYVPIISSLCLPLGLFLSIYWKDVGILVGLLSIPGLVLDATARFKKVPTIKDLKARTLREEEGSFKLDSGIEWWNTEGPAQWRLK